MSLRLLRVNQKQSYPSKAYMLRKMNYWLVKPQQAVREVVGSLSNRG